MLLHTTWQTERKKKGKESKTVRKAERLIQGLAEK